MSTKNEKQPETEPSFCENDDKFRKVYHKPIIEELGDLRTLTLGGTRINPGDSNSDPNWDWPT